MFTVLTLLVCCLQIAGARFLDGQSTYIDGAEQKIRGIDVKYTQYVSIDGQCDVKIADQERLFKEGELVELKNKLYKVEYCQLNRAYAVACQSDLYYQLRDLACAVYSTSSSKRNTIDQPQKNACCDTACTVSELVQSCSPEPADV